MQKTSGAFVQSCHYSYTRAQGRRGLTSPRAESGEAGTRLLSLLGQGLYTRTPPHPTHTHTCQRRSPGRCHSGGG